MSTNYTVYIHPFTERHFIKRFKRKYKKGWDITLVALQEEFKMFDLLFERNIAETIVEKMASKYAKQNFVLQEQSSQKAGRAIDV